MPADPDRAKQIFLAALELPDAAARAAMLDRACAGDPALRDRVAALLAAHAEPGSFIDPPRAPPGTVTAPPEDPNLTRSAPDPDQTAGHDPGPSDPDARAGTVLAGRYRLVRQLGEGGMGAVWLAEQIEPVQRAVAVKLIRPGAASAQVLARFEAERQALAVMNHPNIARVYDAGTTASGRPFFVMEVVDGVPITAYCDARRLTVRDRLELFVPVCQAVQHAHQKGVIHRDIKPSNVLVAEVDGRAVPKVIDFGLAKALAADGSGPDTIVGSVLGTPLYMAPEQAGPDAADVDTRADVYALGAVLYELLTGTTPIDRETARRAALAEVLRLVREFDPPAPASRLIGSGSLPGVAADRRTEPGRLARQVRGELGWITLKCLEKDRGRRYATANGLAADVLRFLADEPVSAGPPSATYRLRKFVRRNRGRVAAAALVLLALVGGVIGTTAGLLEARRQRDAADAARQAEADQRAAAVAERDQKELARAAADAEKERANKAADAARRSASRADTVSGFLIRDLLAQADPRNNAVGDRITVRELLDRASAAVEKNPAVAADPEVEAAIRYLLGNVYLQLGRDADAEPHLRRALAVGRAAFGEADDRTLDAAGDLAVVLRGVRKLDEALAVADVTLALVRARFPAADLRVLRAENNRGLVLADRGELAEAEAAFRGCHERAAIATGLDEAERLRFRANLAWSLQMQGGRGKAAEAFRLLDERLAEFPRLWGARSRDVYAVYDTMGSAARVLGRPGDAAGWLRKAWEGRRHALGEDHADTLSSLNNLALALLDDGRPDEAAEAFRRAAAAPWPPGEGNQRRRAAALFNLGLALRAAGRPGEAPGPLREALATFRRQSGLLHPESLMLAVTLLDALADRGRAADWEESERLLEELLPPVRGKYAPASAELIDVLNRLGQARLWQGKYATAEGPLREALGVREKKQPEVWTTFNSRSLVGEAVLGQGRYEEAERLLVDGYEGMKARAEKIPPAAAVRLPEAANRLVRLYAAWGNRDQAATWKAERAKYPPERAPPPREKK